MAIFGNKKDDEYEDEEELIEEEKEDRKLTRKFRDLNPGNRKKRKEPPKPWGVRERVLVLIILVMTVLVAGVLAISARDYKFPNFTSQIRLPDFRSLNIFKEETIILEKK